MSLKEIFSRSLGLIFVGLIVAAAVVFAGTYLLKKKANPSFLEISGRIEGKEYNASTKVGGRVDDVYVVESQVVKAGEPIAIVYSKQLESTLNSAEAKLKEAQSNLDLAKLEYDRYERLLEKNAAPKMDFDRVGNKLKVAKEGVVVAEKEVERVKADIADTKIVAPVDGVVVTKVVRKGEVVAVGTPIVTIINMDDLYLKAFLPTESAGKVSLRNEAKLFPDALSEEEFPAYVEKIGEKAEFTPRNVETKSQRAKLVFEVRLKVKENRNYILKPGMPCEAVIKLKDKAQWAEYKKQ